jgi:hypothetical protein
MELTDAQARVVAMLWRNGTRQAELYSFAITGSIPRDSHDLLHEIAQVRAHAEPKAQHALDGLAEYVKASGPRGVVFGWLSTWDGEFEKELADG